MSDEDVFDVDVDVDVDDEDGEEDGVIDEDVFEISVAFQDLIDITLRRMDHDRDGRISFSDFSTTVQVHLEKNRFSHGLHDKVLKAHDQLKDCS